MRKGKKCEQGFTYVEIIVCFCVAAIIVGPLSYSYLNSIMTRVSAKHIEEATLESEKMMTELKEKITSDIVLKQQVEGKEISTSGWDASKIDIAKEGVGKYFLSYTEACMPGTSKRPLEKLEALLGNEILAKYNTTDYAYEVALWKTEDLSFDATNTFILNSTQLEKATKFYTDSAYQFDDTFYDSLTNPIKFTITPEMLSTFKDDTYMYIPSYSGSEKILEVNRIDPTSGNDTTSAICYTKEEIKVGADVKGYHFILTQGAKGNDVPEADRANYTNIIELDIRSLLKDASASKIETYKNYTFKFTNKTDFNQVIRVRHNIKDTSDVADEVYDSINVVVENEKAGVKSTISRIDSQSAYDNYLIAIIVREKKPALGEKGKIVKKMLDVYSYDVSAKG